MTDARKTFRLPLAPPDRGEDSDGAEPVTEQVYNPNTTQYVSNTDWRPDTRHDFQGYLQVIGRTAANEFTSGEYDRAQAASEARFFPNMRHKWSTVDPADTYDQRFQNNLYREKGITEGDAYNHPILYGFGKTLGNAAKSYLFKRLLGSGKSRLGSLEGYSPSVREIASILEEVNPTWRG
jgi:hypothetical protein